MTREEKIEILIMDRIWDWVYASNSDTLEDWLAYGFKGYDNYSDAELDKALEEIDDKIEEIQAMIAKKNENE